jgi:RimJ/RimL family protein N-acetyltransferase
VERLTAAPRLETERLVLRAFDLRDVDALQAMWDVPEVHRFITGKPVSRQDIWFKVLRSIGHWQALGFGYWIVEDKVSGHLIGEMGYGDFHRADLPLLNDRPEMGWVLAASHQGRGLAFEALSSIQTWGDLNLPSRQTACIISPGNAASIRIAEKLGFAFAEVSSASEDPVRVYVRRR